MDLEITKFINQRLGAKVLDDNTLSEEQRYKIIDHMIAIVHSHRHNKEHNNVFLATLNPRSVPYFWLF